MIKRILLAICLFIVFPLPAQAGEDLDDFLKLDIRSYSATLGTVLKDMGLVLFKSDFCDSRERVVMRTDEKGDFSKEGCYLIYGPEDLEYLNPWIVTTLIVEKGEKRRFTYHFRLCHEEKFSSKRDFAYMGYSSENMDLSESEIARMFVYIFR